MKRWLAMLMLLVSVSVPQLRAADTAAKPLIPNGDFETDSKNDGTPDGWPKPSETLKYETEEGNHFIRLHAVEPGKMVMIYRSVPVTAEDKGFEFTCRVRYEGIKPGSKPWFDGRIMMEFKDENKKGVKPGPSAPYFRGSSKGQWKPVSVKFVVPEGAKVLEIMPALFQAAAGTLDLDDLKLRPLTEEEAKTIKANAAAAAKKKAEQTAILEGELAGPPLVQELKVAGNQIITSDGKTVWLQGLCVDSMEWGQGDNVLWSLHVALNDWHANCIRLPVHDTRWFGNPKKGEPGNLEAYRALVDQAVKLCAAKGAYLVLDLHQFGAPMPEHVDFWKDAAARYKNNPAVLFELFNEAHGIPWKIWRDGGDLSDPSAQHNDNAVVENNEKNSGKISVGMQALLDAVRSTGARNIVIAGGLGWSYDLSGILQGYALQERPGGNGIVYSHHNYPWKSGWQKAVVDAAEKYPIFVGEVGCPEKWEDFSFIKANERSEKLGPGCTWPNDMLGLIQKHKMHWTGFSFHPKCGPPVISDWNYTPTPYWGAFVKDALAGKTFTMERMR